MTNDQKRSTSGRAVRETLAALGVVASLVFVGFEIRASTTQARAAAYQEIGLATANIHQIIDDRGAQLAIEQNSDEAIAEWSAVDWHRMLRIWLGTFRVWETLQLQTELAVLPDGALERLGWNNTANLAWGSRAFVCLWPAIQLNTSPQLIAHVEAAAPPDLRPCSVPVIGVPGA